MAHKLAKLGSFPRKVDAEVVARMRNISYDCYPPNSFSIGVPESMLGRVVHCVAGKRCFLGMEFNQLFRSYQEAFSEDCCSCVHVCVC